MNQNTLTCAKCGQEKPLDFFYPKYPRRGCRDCRLTPERRAKQALQDRKPRIRFSRGRASSGGRNIPWNLEYDEYHSLILKDCNYCDGPLEPAGIGLDRLDHKRGYTSGNVVPCCAVCNYIRQRVFTPEEMRLIGQCIKQIRADRAAKGLPAPTTQSYYFKLRKAELREAARA